MKIDKLEIEEMLAEYYDFSEWNDADWEKADKEISAECERRGLNPNDGDDAYDEYSAVCDGVCGRIFDDKTKEGINPKFADACKKADRKEKAEALNRICQAIWGAERLYEVADESGHPLDKAYEIIYDFIVSEGLDIE